ncbi:DNA cytosine methyltransferase [Oxalobacter sp. OttesenSCG-928-P03]|nr:DNA cytosine methyltransferase [Oxalobacter sp. OttesenSCG-928-P03]
MIKVFDFFSGCGGTSCGFRQAGLDIVFGLDFDADSANTFRKNFPRATFECGDIRLMHTSVISPLVQDRSNPILFSGCAPCQPFSRQNRQKKQQDSRTNLLYEFSRFVKDHLPDYIFIENVPGMQKIKESDGPLCEFINLIKLLDYKYDVQVIPALWFGVPQTRERLVLLASRLSPISLPEATHGEDKKPYSTVRDWIGNLPPISAGEIDENDKCHHAANLTPINLKRISTTPEGGGREHWPPNLWLDCHKNHKGHTDVYGRLAWDKPASGLTTRCISYSNGRFGHPEQNRAISAREAACLQTFPVDFKFEGALSSIARQIGNAVPPLMARHIGESIKKHALAET